MRVAVGLARPGDVVLLAGKGHEATQTTGGHDGALRRPRGGGGRAGGALRGRRGSRPVISLMTSGGVALWVAVLTTPLLIRWLLKNNIGQQIREDGPQVHIAKAGTPTMGGICILGAVLVGFLPAHVIPGVHWSRSGVLVMWAIIGAAAIGFADDWIKVRHRRSLGLNKRAKFDVADRPRRLASRCWPSTGPTRRPHSPSPGTTRSGCTWARPSGWCGARSSSPPRPTP